jgi:hypothetical protein
VTRRCLSRNLAVIVAAGKRGAVSTGDRSLQFDDELLSGEYPELFVTLQCTVSPLTRSLGAWTTPWEMANKGF